MKTIQDPALYRRIQLSALADSELHGEEFAEAMAWFEGDSPQAEQTRAIWRNLHVVGDVLRSDELAACSKDMVFLDRLKLSLAQEPALVSEHLMVSSTANIVQIEATDLTAEPVVALQSANDSVFRWKWAAGFASVAAAVAISWNLLGGVVATSGAQLALSNTASQQATAVTQDAQTAGTVMLRNPQLDALLAAHGQLGGNSALQMPSGFLRNATFDAAAIGQNR